MQNKCYTIQFFSPPDSRWCYSRIHGTNGFCWPRQTHVKVQTHRKARTQEKGSNSGKRVFSPWPTFIYKMSMMSMVWNISIGQLGLAVRLCSLPTLAHLLISQTWKSKKVLDFLATTKNISLLSVCCSYWIQNTAATGEDQKQTTWLPKEQSKAIAFVSQNLSPKITTKGPKDPT